MKPMAERSKTIALVIVVTAIVSLAVFLNPRFSAVTSGKPMCATCGSSKMERKELQPGLWMWECTECNSWQEHETY